MNEFTELINGFNRAITPANAMLHEIEVQLTSQSFSNGLINETIKKNNLQQEISTNVQNAISAALFAKALSFGFPKKLPPKEILPQVIYGNSTLAFYFEELQRYVSSVPDFIDEYMKVLKDLISGKENDYSKIVYGIVDHIGIIQTLALATDFENRQIPSQYLIVPTIKPHLEQFSNQVLGIVKSGEAYRIASMNRQPTSELETALDTLVKTAKETIQKQIELFGDIKQKINDSFVPSYNEDAYDHFQQYAQQYSSTLASICLLSLKIGMNVPNTLHIIAQVLEKMTKFGYDMFAPILNIMRFRDKFEKSIENSKDAHENIGQIFAPLLQSLVNIQPQLLIPFQNFVNAQFVLLFQKLQKLNSEYDDEMNKLISVLRQDKKFSVFQTVGQLSQSDLSDAAKASMEVTSKILTQLLKTGSSIEEISENIKTLNSEYSKFNAFIQTKINQEKDAQQLIKLIQHRDSISKSLIEFVDGFKSFSLNPTNALIRNKAGIHTSAFLLSLCGLDTTNPIIKQLTTIRQLLADNIVRFYPNNMKALIEICTIFHNRKDEIPLQTRQQFLGIYSVFMDSLRKTSNVFSSNSNSNNPQNVINCIKEYDMLKYLIKGLIVSLKDPNIPKDLLPLINNLEIFLYNITEIPNSFKLSFQIHYKHCVDAFTQYMGPFFEMIISAATVQSEEYYQHFREVKNSINEGIKSIKERLEHPPPFGIYDKKYILGLIGTSKDVFQPTFDILKESQEILRNAHAPAQLKVGVNSITQILSLIGQLMTYIGALTIEGEIPMKSLIVFAIKDCCDDVGIKINNLKQVINDQVKVSQFGQQLITSLCEYSDALEKIEQLKPLSEQIRLMSNNIGENIVRIAIGDNTQIPTLNSIFDNILAFNQKLKPFSDKFISEVQSIGEIETKKTQEEKPKYNEFISHLPTEEETEKMFIDIMQSNNDALKTLLSKCVTSLKEDIDEFKQLFEEYNKNQNKDINEKIKMIAERIEKGKDIIKKGIEFAPKEIVEIDSLNSMIEKLKKYNNEEKSKTVPEIIMNLAEYVNKNYKEPVNSMLNNLISDILMLMKTNPSLGQTQLETFIYALKGNPEDITIEALEKLKKSKNKFEIYDFLQKALFANVIQKLMSGQSNPLNDPDSIQSKLHKYASQIDETNKEATDYFDLTQLISQFEDLVIGTDETNEMDSEMISDKLMDINSEIVSLGTEISNDLKKVTTNSMPTITTKLNNLRAKAFEILNISLVSSSKRNEVDKNITNELQEETIKLIELLNNYTNEISKVVNSSNKNSQIRNVNKINREINMCIGHISEITDEIIETPISIIESSTEDYNIISNHLMCDILKLEQLSYDNSKAKQLKFNKIHSSLNLKLQKFASNIKNITKGIDEEDNINEMVNDLQKLFGKLTTNDATTLTTEFPLKLSKVVNEIKTKVIDSLNTEITPQPKFVSHLPYRFNIPNITETPSKEIVQLKSIFDTKYNIVKSSIDKFIISLNSSKTPPEQIEKHFNEFQSSLSELIIPVSLIQTSTWNLECQNQLLKAKNSLINAGDISIESTRNRFLGNEGWRESISMFNTTIESALEQAKNVIDSTMKSIEEDLSVTNELEKELIIAACSCQSSMQRLNSLKNKAIEQKITIGDNYLGCDIIEVSTPILNNAAKLIDVAKSQTKFVSQKNPEIINQKGLINTANNLVDSLELIIIAAEATVNNEPEAMSKILAGCNLISQAVAHFLVENNQKAGSPELNVTLRKITDSVQYLIKQLRQFAEAAMDAEKNKQNTESNVTGTKRPLNNMIAKLNAEAKVVAARKALEEAEKLAKEARQGK